MVEMPAPQSSLRFLQRTVDVDLRLHYAEVPSDDRPLVLLHGIGMDWRVWQAISRRLSPHFHLYMVDLRGHGESEKPLHGYSLANYAADVEDFIDALDLENVVLVGSSLGGAVSVVVEAPADLVSHRVLVDPPLTGGPVRDAEMFRQILQLKHIDPSQLADYLADRNPGAGRFLVEAMSDMWHRAADGVITDLLANEENYFAIDSAMTAVESPTLIMRADPECGGVLTESQASHARNLLPQGNVVYVPGAGHAIHATKPAEFVRLLLAFTAQDIVPRESPGTRLGPTMGPF